MNERIDELANLAGLHKEWFIDNPEIEKFAELLVRECATITWLGVDDANGTYGNELFVKLKEHFGVK